MTAIKAASYREISVTQALAEIKTLKQRLAKAREFVLRNIAYPAQLVDPLNPSGGSAKAVGEKRQSIRDMESRVVLLRMLIAQANEREMLTLGGMTMTLAEWLIWKREVGPDQRRMLMDMQNTIGSRRIKVQEAVRGRVADTPSVQVDLTVAVDEVRLALEIDEFEDLWGALDGQLSQRNATILISLPV